MRAIGSRAAARAVLAVCLCLPLALAAGAGAEEGGEVSPPSSLAAFEELFARLTGPQAEGRVPEVGASAEELRFRLRIELIRDDAEIDVLKLEAARFSGGRQAAALDALVEAAAARERRIWGALRQLESLAGEPWTVPAAAATEGSMPEASAVGEVMEENAAPEGDAAAAGRGFSIVFEPQDIAEDPDP